MPETANEVFQALKKREEPGIFFLVFELRF